MTLHVCITVCFRKARVLSSSATLLSSTDIRCEEFLFFLQLHAHLIDCFKRGLSCNLSQETHYHYKRAKASSSASEIPPCSPPLTCTCWVDGGHTGSPQPACLCLALRVARRLKSVPSDPKENEQKSSFWKECQTLLIYMVQLRGF